MSVSNNKIDYRMGKKLGVNYDGDLQTVFGVSQVKHSWFFLTAPINMWAKFKPFRHPNHTIYTDHYKGQTGQDLPSSVRLAGARQVNYGLIPPSVAAGGTTETNIPANVVDQLWTYAPCQDNIDPMQAFDFEGYNHNAQPPIMPMNPSNVDPVLGSQVYYYPASQTQGIDFSGIERGPRDDAICLSDFSDLDGWYVCILLCNNYQFRSTDSWEWKTASDPISLNTSGGVGSMVPCPKLTHSEINNFIASGRRYQYYYICLADTKRDDLTQSQVQTMFKPIPAGSVQDLKGVINVNYSFVTNVTILSAAFISNPGVNDYADMTNYTGAGDDYYDINQHYYVALKVRLKAPQDRSVTVNRADLRMSLSTTFNGGAPRLLGVSLRNSSYVAKETITINADTSEDVYIIYNGQALAIDETGSEAMVTENGKELSVLFTFSHNGITFTNDQYIRLTNP